MGHSSKNRPLLLACLLLLALAAGLLLWLNQDSQPNTTEALPSSSAAPAEELMLELQAAVAQGNWQNANALEERMASAGPAAIPELQKLLAQELEATSSQLLVAQRAAWVLGEIGGPEAVSVLTRALEIQKTPALRGQLALGLSRVKAPSAEQALRPLQQLLLASDEDDGLRRSAALLLAKHPESMAAAFLVATVREHKAPQADPWIVEALGFTPHLQTAAPLLRELARDQQDPLRRAAALRALARLEREGALELLAAALRTEPDAQARQGVLSVMKDWAPSPKVQALLSRMLTEDPDPGVRVLAAEALGQPGRSENLVLLESAILKDNSVYVRLKTLAAVGRVGGKSAEALLEKIAGAEQPAKVRGLAKSELQKIRGEKHAPVQPRTMDEEVETKTEEF